jgi:hypothetical protein
MKFKLISVIVILNIHVVFVSPFRNYRNISRNICKATPWVGMDKSGKRLVTFWTTGARPLAEACIFLFAIMNEYISTLWPPVVSHGYQGLFPREGAATRLHEAVRKVYKRLHEKKYRNCTYSVYKFMFWTNTVNFWQTTRRYIPEDNHAMRASSLT